MKAILRSGVVSAICFLGVLLSNAASYGQTFRFRDIERDSLHTAEYINNHGLSDTIVVSHALWDMDMVTNSSGWAANLKFKSVHDFVRFSIDYSDTLTKVMEPYTIRLTYTIYGFSNPATPNVATAHFDDTLTISYKPDSLATFQDKQYMKYSGYHKIMIVLTGLYKIDNASGVPQPVTLGPSSNFSWFNFNVEGAIIAQPYNKKVKTGSGYKEAYGINGLLEIKRLDTANDNLPVYWQMKNTTLNPAGVLPLMPVNYELEWTYVDDYKVSMAGGGSTSAIAASNLQYNFADNATRVVLDTNYYKIPLIYQRGYIVYRVRIVRPDSVNYQYPIYSPWTIVNATGTVSSVSNDYKYYVNPHINDSLNWQYTVSFAEQGKYKHVMSYYDGMLKNRQSITRFNSMPAKLIATEQVYDYEGRPTISILPTPITSSRFRYQPGLAMNSNTNMPFRPEDFDSIQLTSCPNDILLPPLSATSLANIYYSSSNPDQGGFQKFVPDAGGFPLVQTIYSAGYDERVEKQGGAGDTLQIGHKHNVKNDYTGTEQTDLNRLFGTNIGWTGYYRKTTSRDPNGQLSINITDYRGKTMMSSMVGLPDTALHALVSNENLADSVQYTDDFLAGIPQQITGNQRILDKLFFNEAPGNNTSKYVYHFKPFETFCFGKYLTVRAAYDYTIFDECGTTVAHSDSVLGQTGVLSSATADTFFQTPPLGFYMEKGKHSLNKVLTINTDDVALAVDSFISLPITENCMKDEPWFIKESVLSKQYPCPESYLNLQCPACGSFEYEMMKELFPNVDSSYMERKYGIYRIINGVVVGNNNSDFTLFCGHGSDPGNWTHHFGADTFAHLAGTPGEITGSTITGIGNWPTGNNIGGAVVTGGPYVVLTNDTLHCRYRYQDTCVVKMPDTVIKYGNIYTNLQQLPVEEFISIFNDSIAKALLPMHPEYCELLDCVDNDVFPRQIGRIPDAKIAEALHLLTLADIIHADPIYTAMLAHPVDFPNPEALLSYLPGGILCLDTIAFNEAYCRSTDANMLADCQTGIYQYQIANGLLINDYVKERYFRSIKNVYLANRKRFLYVLNPSFSGLVDCSICAPVRMDLVPQPIFPDNDSIGASLLDNFVTSLTTGTSQPPSGSNPASGSTATEALQQYFEAVQGVNLDTVITVDVDDVQFGVDSMEIGPLDNIADSSIAGYIANANLIMQATIAAMDSQFVNCTPFGNITAVNAYLLNLYVTGQVTNFTFTPQQVLAALQAGSMTLDDLCNPYIVNYDGLATPPSDGSAGIECGNTVYFNDMGSFLTASSLAALQHPGTPYPGISLSGSNQFAQTLGIHLNSSSCSVLAAFNSTQHLYTLTYSAGAATVKISMKEPPSSPGVNPFVGAPGETVSLIASCYKEVFGIFPAGYIGNLSFALTAKHTPSSGPVVTHRMKAWNDTIGLNDLRDNPISQCVPFTQFRDLYQQYWAVCGQGGYGIRGASHPMYRTTLRNFMNYNLKKVFTESQYTDFVESSAMADSMRIKDFVVFHKEFSDSTAAFTFIGSLYNYVPGVNVYPSYIYKNPNGHVQLGVNLLGVPKNKLRIYYNYIEGYACVGNFPNMAYQDFDGTNYMAAIFAPVSATVTNAAIFNGAANSFSVAADNIYGVFTGTGFEPYKVYNFYSPVPNNHASNSRNMAILEQYVYEHLNSAIFTRCIKHTVNSEYYLPEKQGYLKYAYGSQDQPPNRVLDTLQVGNLQALIPSLSGMNLSYGHPARPDNIQNLYVGDPATALSGTKYNILENIIISVGNYFNNLYGNTDNNILFSGANTRNVTMPSGEVLTAYRCRDTAFWYRYFGQGDTLYNVFLRVPGYIDTQYYSGYKLADFGYNLGEGNSRSFWMKFQNVNAPIKTMTLNGYSDFTVAKNKLLHDVLLTHEQNVGMPPVDTVYNCERAVLNAAVYEGKIRYRFYRDSVRNKLYGDFYAYIMNGGITEKLLVSYRNQRFNYTLYNYDRAGNLVATVPPAGVFPVPAANLPNVNTYRQDPTLGNIIAPDAKVSTYSYNTLNQVFNQVTPDGGSTDFYYDAAGRVIFSQNDKQRPYGKMTYILYDKQGRAFETGQAGIGCPWFAVKYHATPDTIGPNNCYYYDAVNHIVSSLPGIVTDLRHKTNDQVIAYMHAMDREEVVYTHYDAPNVDLTANPGFSAQENLRKRVAAVKYFAILTVPDSLLKNYRYAMHFSYDIAGNVKTLVRDYPAYKTINQQLKRVDYDYDVISGKVNLLSYNRGFPDQFYQKYDYDADNRITEVNTSNDGIIWQRDAAYQYYQHGPLARMSLGELRVQGVDYAYTIQGWLKAVNGDVLDPGKDMGEDGAASSVGIHPPDAVALSLDYFKGDYKPIGDTAVTHIEALGKNLYNGNIPRATTSIIPFPDLKSQYTYDQLNRIVRADYAYMNRADAVLTNTADYYSSYAYDPDGNLKKLVRNGNSPNPAMKQMDSLKYYYGSYNNFSTANNKLLNITDWTPDSNYPNTADITQYQQPNTSRYTYDATGNVTQDLVSGQGAINWDHYNKVASDYNYGQGHLMDFEYDGAGNRYLKSVSTFGTNDTTSLSNEYNVRDAQGNILAVYKDEADYTMGQQQWIEYITAQMYVRCNRWNVLRRYITPYYGSNTYFKAILFDHVMANNATWAQNLVNNEDVSYYLKTNSTVSGNFISGLYSYPSVFTDMANWGNSNGVSLMGPYVNSNFGFINGDAGGEEAKSFIAALLTPLMPNPTNVEGGILSLLCSQAPELMQTAMEDFNVPGGYQAGAGNCAQNAENLNTTLVDNGYNGKDLINEIYALHGNNQSQYAAFLAQLYSSDTRYGMDEESQGYSLLQALCVNAPGIFGSVMGSYHGESKGDCIQDAANLYALANPVNAASLMGLNDRLMDAAKAYPGEFESLADMLWSGRIATESDAAASDRVLSHLVESMPVDFLNGMFESLGISYDENAPETWKDTLSQYLGQAPGNPAFAGAYIAESYNQYPTVSNDDGYHPYHLNNFMDSIVGDPVIIASSYFTESGIGQAGLFGICVAALDNGGLDRFDADKMYGFIDQWPQARTALEQTSSEAVLMDAVYNSDPALFIDNYITAAGGNDGILTQSLMAIPNLTLNTFVNNLYLAQADIFSIPEPQWCLRTVVIDSIVHSTYERSLHSRRFSLASHVIYGSRRLGTKDYLPGEYYKYYNAADGITDTVTLGGYRPWYNLEVNDWIAGLALDPYNGADASSYYATHHIGAKQYEISNHLGNVQATLTDLPYWSTDGNDYGIIARKSAAMAAAYDYYPFGMLMPDRFVSDTSNKCMTVTQTKWITKWVDSCYDVYSWVWPYFQLLNEATYKLDTSLNYVDVVSKRIGGGVTFGFSTVPGSSQHVSFDIAEVVTGTAIAEAGHLINGQWLSLGNLNINRSGITDLLISPTENVVYIRMLGVYRIRVRRVCIQKPVQVQQTYLVDICNDVKDRYRFGFNGQEKVNEWAGIGNHNTAEFWEYDTRTGRRLNLDPIDQINISNYAAFRNSPISVVDIHGDDPESKNGDEENKNGDEENKNEEQEKSKTNVLASTIDQKKWENRDFDIANDAMQLDEVVIETTKPGPNDPDENGYYNVVQAARMGIGDTPAARERAARTDATINAMYCFMGGGAMVPVVVVGAAYSAPIMYTAFLSNPVVWTEIGGATILGSSGYGGESPTGGTIAMVERATVREAEILPMQIHHFATNKNTTYTPKMAEIAENFGLNLNGSWNKQGLPHLGRHPNAYHDFVLDGMRRASAGSGGTQAGFLNLFDQYVKQPVIQNPGLLRKSGWTN